MSDDARIALQVARIALDLAERAGADQREVAHLRKLVSGLAQRGYTTVNEPPQPSRLANVRSVG